MSAKKTTNVTAIIYEDGFDLTFDCVGVTVCKYALCEFMLPDGDYPCWHSEHGSCRYPHAQYAAIEMLRRRLAKELNRLEKDCEGNDD